MDDFPRLLDRVLLVELWAGLLHTDHFAFQFGPLDLQLDVLDQQTMSSFAAALVMLHKPHHPWLVGVPHFDEGLAEMFGPELHLHLIEFLHGVPGHIGEWLGYFHLQLLKALAE